MHQRPNLRGHRSSGTLCLFVHKLSASFCFNHAEFVYQSVCVWTQYEPDVQSLKDKLMEIDRTEREQER